MDVLIVANGELKNKPFCRKAAKGKDIIIAADGGADNCIKIGLTPNYIIGDFDSISKQAMKKFKDRSNIVHDETQNSTDMEKSIDLAKKLKCTSLEVICATGLRTDHAFSNIISLLKAKFPSKITDGNHEIFIVTGKITISGKKGDSISVLPVSKVKGLTYSGLKWQVKNKNVETGWLGTSNEMIENRAEIKLKSGKVIVIKTIK
jgi:thiamine pyrophosphokinase